MDRTEFVKAYVAAFLGALAANVTQDARPNWQRTIVSHPPVEDAVFQAEETWKRCREIQPDFFR